MPVAAAAAAAGAAGAAGAAAGAGAAAAGAGAATAATTAATSAALGSAGMSSAVAGGGMSTVGGGSIAGAAGAGGAAGGGAAAAGGGVLNSVTSALSGAGHYMAAHPMDTMQAYQAVAPPGRQQTAQAPPMPGMADAPPMDSGITPNVTLSSGGGGGAAAGGEGSAPGSDPTAGGGGIIKNILGIFGGMKGSGGRNVPGQQLAPNAPTPTQVPQEEKPGGFLGLTPSERKELFSQSIASIVSAQAQSQTQAHTAQPGGFGMGLDQSMLGLGGYAPGAAPQGMAEGGELQPGDAARVGNEVVRANVGGGATVAPGPDGTGYTSQAQHSDQAAAEAAQVRPQGAQGPAVPAESGLWPHIGAHLEDALIFVSALHDPNIFMQMRTLQYNRNVQLAQMGAKDPNLLADSTGPVAQSVDKILGPNAAYNMSPRGHNSRIAAAFGIQTTTPGAPQADGTPAPAIEAQVMRSRPDIGWTVDDKGYLVPRTAPASFADKASAYAWSQFDAARQQFLGAGHDWGQANRLAGIQAQHLTAAANLPVPKEITSLATGDITAEQAEDGRQRSQTRFAFDREFNAARGRAAGGKTAAEELPVEMKDAPFFFDLRTGMPMELTQKRTDPATGETQFSPLTPSDVRQYGVRVSPQALATNQAMSGSVQFLSNWNGAVDKLFPDEGKPPSFGQMVMRGTQYQISAWSKGTLGPQQEETKEAVATVNEAKANLMTLLRGAAGDRGRIAVQQIEQAERVGPGFFDTRTTAKARIRFYAGLVAAAKSASGLPLGPSERSLFDNLYANGRQANYPEGLTSQVMGTLYGAGSTPMPLRNPPVPNVQPQGGPQPPAGSGPTPPGGGLPPGVTFTVNH